MLSIVSQTRYLTFVINLYLYMNFLYLMEIFVDQMNIFVFCMTDICINIQNCENFGSRQSKTFQPFGSLVPIKISKITKRTVICVQKNIFNIINIIVSKYAKVDLNSDVAFLCSNSYL